VSARDTFAPASSDGTCTEAVWGPMCDEIDRLGAELDQRIVDRTTLWTEKERLRELVDRLTIEANASRNSANRWAYKMTLLTLWVKQNCTVDQVAEARAASTIGGPGEPFGKLATLYLSWEELDVTADCLDAAIEEMRPAFPATLNSLRTAFREAQYTVER